MLGPEHVGRRVAVRIRLEDAGPGHRFRDITGELIEVGTHNLRVRPATGAAVTIDAADVVAARAIPPKPTPFSEILELQRHLAATWPAVEAEELGGWLLRYSEGFSRRSDSVLALTEPDGGLDAAIDAASAWYAERGARPMIALSGPVTKRLDQELAARGWESEGAAAVLTKPIEPVRHHGEAHVVNEPSADLLEQVGRGKPEVAAKVLGSGPNRGFAEVRRTGVLAARGRGAVEGGSVSISGIGTRPEFRRQGLGTEVLRALEAWGAQAGARRSVLQVETANLAAIAMYERLGYVERFRYWYRAR